VLTLIVLGLPAFAFTPSSEVYIGQEPVRTRTVHIGPQMRLRSAPEWSAFSAGEGAGWQVRFDERTGTPHVAWGPGIELGTLQSEADVERAAWSFLSRNEDLLGMDVGDLRFGRAIYDSDRDAWQVRLDRVVRGSNQAQQPSSLGGDLGSALDLPDLENAEPAQMSEALAEMARYGQPRVWRGGVDLRIQNGNLTMFRMDTYPMASEIETTPRVSAADAIRIAIQDGPEAEAEHEVDGAVLIVLPWEEPGTLEQRLCWLVRTSTNLGTGHPGIWASFVDAQTGELVNVHNQIRFITGTVYGEHDTRTVNGEMSVSPMPFVSVASDGDSDKSDLEGQFDLSGDTFSVNLDGTWFSANNQAGPDGRLNFSGSEGVWTSDDATQAEISSYVFLHHVWEWGEYYAPEVGITNTRINTNLNLDSNCNAYYDGDVNFYTQGSGCNNTGRIADVNYHEWGHGFHAYAADTWWVDGSIGEGSSDVVSFFQTGDNIVAPYFNTNGSGIRDVSPDRVYPDDWIDQVHTDGLIFAGAVWDLWGILEEDLGEDQAYDQTVELFVATLKTNPSTPDTYDEFIAADDDNGDLGDGTPNQCSIMDAFSLHGLGPGGSSSMMELAHEGIGNQIAGLDAYAIEAELLNLAPLCSELESADVELLFSTNGGEDYSSVDLSLDGDTISGSIPGQSQGTIVHYYIYAETDDGSSLMSPSGGFIAPFTFVVGELDTIYCEDFEADDGGYIHELIAGEDIEGADDWQWGQPGGLGGDPDFAWSGSSVWGNDLAPEENWNGEYQNEKFNRLTSIGVDVSGYEQVVLEYRRWLTVEDGYYDQARIRSNGEVVWENYATSRNEGEDHTQDVQWVQHVVDISGTDEDGVVELSWEIESDQGLSMGGWNIDDVCLKGVLISNDDPGEEEDTEDDGGSDPSGSALLDIEDGSLSGCNCSTSSSTPKGLAFWAALLGVVGLSRRRRR
jgi:MYXO-CTERM domain-containing protein